MKSKRVPVFVFIGLLLCLFASCKKKQAEPTELEKLPPATQTGANTFGCLVNGQAFLPKANFGNGAPYQCNYIYYNGNYNFTVGASYDGGGNSSTAIVLGTIDLPISQGQTLKLSNYNQSGKGFGELLSITNYSRINDYLTTVSYAGELHIAKLDQTNQIVAGTFFFDAVNTNGEIVHITDGRFDMKYTR
jgi:hypothetical protein